MSVSIPSNSRFYHYRFMLNGRIYTGSTKTANKAAALRYEASIRTEAHANVMLGDPERITLKDAFQKYLDTKKKLTSYNDYLTRTNKQLGITKTKDRQDATVFGFSPDKFLDTLKTSDMQHLIIERGNEGIQSSTLVHEIGIWAGMVTLMKRLGYKVPTIDFIHLRADNGVKPNKGNVRYLTVDEEQKLLWALDPKQKWPRQTTYEEMPEQMKRDKQDIFDLVILLLETGARYTEIAELKWCNVNILAQTLTLYRPKVKNVSTLELSNRAYDVLLRRFNDPQRNEWVFTNDVGGPRNYSPFAFMNACKRAGLEDVSFHTLRHTFATRMVQAGLPITALQQLLGHATITMTMRYSHLGVQDSSRQATVLLNKLNAGKQPLLTQS